MPDQITLTDAAEGRPLGPVTLAAEADPAEMSFAEIAAECERIGRAGRGYVVFSISYDSRVNSPKNARPHVYVTTGHKFEFFWDGSVREQFAAAERWAVEHHAGSLSDLRAQIDAVTTKLRALGEAV